MLSFSGLSNVRAHNDLIKIKDVTHIKHSGFELLSERWIHVLEFLLRLLKRNSDAGKEFSKLLLSRLSPKLELGNNIVRVLDALMERPVSQ